ncbi:hypothetical protein GPECTOR_12g532 [Gonium pectorale]|uniref:Protein kinase domain-containing protein n=1 Tax=Gonium pectorale TaxID=33097 RepID=A0A150GP04_GONPE|nr:hypothetical protein GPECTOR_12g532 [Gonium pectorale]|eukprot:KXZ51569.1 hypothetical protein GPECTOR_12g532 [Gonium pectorale]
MGRDLAAPGPALPGRRQGRQGAAQTEGRQRPRHSGQGGGGHAAADDDGDNGGAAGDACRAADLAALYGIRRWPYVLYISMELVVGPTLSSWLQQRAKRLGAAGAAHPPDPSTERSIFRQIVTGLAHVHAAGIIHRDLKPANIFLVPVLTAAAAPAATHGSSGAGKGHAAAADAGPESFLVKLGDFGLAVDHADPSVLLSSGSSGTSLSPASSATLSEGASTFAHSGPIPSSAAARVPAALGLAKAGGGLTRATLPRPASCQLLLAAADGGGGGVGAPVAAAAAAAARVGAAAGGGTSGASGSGSGSARTAGVGTASYSAPEQLATTARGRGGDGSDGGGGGAVSYYGPEVDIYPLGLILMELFCVHTTGLLAEGDQEAAVLLALLAQREAEVARLRAQLAGRGLLAEQLQRPRAAEPPD